MISTTYRSGTETPYGKLLVDFKVNEWSERESYGDTSAVILCSDVEIVDITLDDRSVTEKELALIMTYDRAREAVDRALEDR